LRLKSEYKYLYSLFLVFKPKEQSVNRQSMIFVVGMITCGLMQTSGWADKPAQESKSMKAEIEIKFFIEKDILEQRLQVLGATIATPRRLMRRQLFWFPLSQRKPDFEQIARVRDEGNCITMTLKQTPSGERNMSSVQELEVVVSDFDAAVQIFTMSGYEPMTYQENRRTSWKFEGCSIEIDEWPGLPVYAEIEAPSEAELKRVAGLLSIDETSFMCCSVFDLYQKESGLDAKKMRRLLRLTFENFEQVTKDL
jgi:predicted adenylyl cyclase CyaB